MKNQGDALVHATNKSLDELGDKVTEEDRKNIQEKNSLLTEALKTEDKDAIEKAINELSEASAKMAEMMYAEQAEKSEDPTTGDSENTEQEAKESDVVDADFKEVNDDKK